MSGDKKNHVVSNDIIEQSNHRNWKFLLLDCDTQSRNGGACQIKVTSLPGAKAPLKMDILTQNKVWNMATELLLTSGMVNLMGPFWPQN